MDDLDKVLTIINYNVYLRLWRVKKNYMFKIYNNKITQ